MRKVRHADVVTQAVERALTFAALAGGVAPSTLRETAFRQSAGVLDSLAADPLLFLPDVREVDVALSAMVGSYKLTDASIEDGVTGEADRIVGIRYATLDRAGRETPLSLISDPSEWASVAEKGRTSLYPTHVYWNRLPDENGATTIYLAPVPSEAGDTLKLYVWETPLQELTQGGETHFAPGEFNLLVAALAVGLAAPMGMTTIPAPLVRELELAKVAVRRTNAQRHRASSGVRSDLIHNPWEDGVWGWGY